MEYILYILITTTQMTCGVSYSNGCSANGIQHKQVQFWQHGGLFKTTNVSKALENCNAAAKELSLKPGEFKCVKAN